MQDDKRIRRSLSIERLADVILGERLTEARAKQQMPLTDLAHILGFSAEEIIDHEQARFSLTAVRLAWMVPVLMLDPVEILADLPEPQLIAGLREVPHSSP